MDMKRSQYFLASPLSFIIFFFFFFFACLFFFFFFAFFFAFFFVFAFFFAFLSAFFSAFFFTLVWQPLQWRGMIFDTRRLRQCHGHDQQSTNYDHPLALLQTGGDVIDYNFCVRCSTCVRNLNL